MSKSYAKSNGKKRKSGVAALIVLNCILAILIAAIIAFCFINHGTAGINPEELGIDETVPFEKGITNLVFFGIDSSEERVAAGDLSRSDSIIIVSLDQNRSEIKLTNILRDSKVPIEGHDPQKINAAYAFGGPELAIKTINRNFRMNIRDYVTVDFGGIESIVDLLGGVEMELTAEEAGMVPGSVEGVNLLNGEQAMLYSRIRHIDSDYYRASRQQKVLEALLEKLEAVPLIRYPALIGNLLNCVETSLQYTRLLGTILKLKTQNMQLISNTIPDYDYETDLWGGIDDTGAWVWIYDLDAAADRLHHIIYES